MNLNISKRVVALIKMEMNIGMKLAIIAVGIASVSLLVGTGLIVAGKIMERYEPANYKVHS